MMSAPGSRVDTPKFVRAEGRAAPLGPAAMPVLTADSRRIGTLPPKELDGALKGRGRDCFAIGAALRPQVSSGAYGPVG